MELTLKYLKRGTEVRITLFVCLPPTSFYSILLNVTQASYVLRRSLRLSALVIKGYRLIPHINLSH